MGGAAPYGLPACAGLRVPAAHLLDARRALRGQRLRHARPGYRHGQPVARLHLHRYRGGRAVPLRPPPGEPEGALHLPRQRLFPAVPHHGHHRHRHLYALLRQGRHRAGQGVHHGHPALHAAVRRGPEPPVLHPRRARQRAAHLLPLQQADAHGRHFPVPHPQHALQHA